MLVKVLLIPVGRDYVVLLGQDKRQAKFPRQYAKHVRAGDICMLGKLGNRYQLKVLTDDDEVVIMNHPDRKQMVPAGYFIPVATPEPIKTPEV